MLALLHLCGLGWVGWRLDAAFSSCCARRGQRRWRRVATDEESAGAAELRVGKQESSERLPDPFFTMMSSVFSPGQ